MPLRPPSANLLVVDGQRNYVGLGNESKTKVSPPLPSAIAFVPGKNGRAGTAGQGVS